MFLDALLPFDARLPAIPEIAAAAEKIGFSLVWVAETSHNPFLAATLIAEHSHKLQIGTGIAVSFARSPAVLAHQAWDLSDFSTGRFMLGLGTQIKAHIERRFGMPWPDSPKQKLREQVQSVRAFWNLWQNGEALNHRGQYYKLSLSSPFFQPDAIAHPDIPIFLAGVNPGMADLAGELADGFLIHPFHSPDYLKTTLLPAITKGLERSQRTRADIQILANCFVVTNTEERVYAKQQLAFYASTPAYRKVLGQHGFLEEGKRLSALAARKRWEEMPSIISDDFLNTFALVSSEADLAPALQDRYAGIADRVALYTPYIPSQRENFWRNMVQSFNK